jgi:hypothetical protein
MMLEDTTETEEKTVWKRPCVDKQTSSKDIRKKGDGLTHTWISCCAV